MAKYRRGGRGRRSGPRKRMRGSKNLRRAVQMIAQAQVKKNFERKYMDGFTQVTLTGTGGAVFPDDNQELIDMFLPNMGSGVSQRVGQKITLRSLSIMGRIIHNDVDTAAHRKVRGCLWNAKALGGVKPKFSDIYNTDEFVTGIKPGTTLQSSFHHFRRRSAMTRFAKKGKPFEKTLQMWQVDGNPTILLEDHFEKTWSFGKNGQVLSIGELRTEAPAQTEPDFSNVAGLCPFLTWEMDEVGTSTCTIEYTWRITYTDS